MTTDSSNPILKFIHEQIDYFTSECIRLQNDKVLYEYNKLVETFFSIQQKLGTIEHEIALFELSKEYSLARSEAVGAWKEIWRMFRKQGTEAKWLNFKIKKGNPHIKAIEDILQKKTECHSEIDQSMHDALSAMKQAESLFQQYEKSQWKVRYMMLWMNIQNYSVFVNYFLARLSFLALRHSFILIVSILIFGIGYSKITSGITAILTSIASGWPLLGTALIFVAYLMKKYYVDAKLKKLQVRLEARWLSRVTLHLHFVRTLALISQSRDMETEVAPGF